MPLHLTFAEYRKNGMSAVLMMFAFWVLDLLWNLRLVNT